MTGSPTEAGGSGSSCCVQDVLMVRTGCPQGLACSAVPAQESPGDTYMPLASVPFSQMRSWLCLDMSILFTARITPLRGGAAMEAVEPCFCRLLPWSSPGTTTVGSPRYSRSP